MTMPGTAAPSAVWASPPNQATRSGGGNVRAIAIAASVSACVGAASRAAFVSSSRAAAGSRARPRIGGTCDRSPERLFLPLPLGLWLDFHSEPQTHMRGEADQADAEAGQEADRGPVFERDVDRRAREVELDPRDARRRDAGRAAVGRNADAAAEAEVPIDVEVLRTDQRRHLEQIVEAQRDTVE